jgi:hypothetical protein
MFSFCSQEAGMKETAWPGVASHVPGREAARRAEPGAAQVYIDTYVRQRFYRELDGEEAVIRSLPFYATATSVLFAAIGVAAPHLRHEPPGIAASVGVVFGLDAALVAFSLACLLAALVRRGVLDVAPERELLRQMGEAADEAERALPEADAAERESLVLSRVRGRLLAEMILATARNRQANNRRKTWRNRAFASLVGALLLTFIGLVATFAAGGGP